MAPLIRVEIQKAANGVFRGQKTAERSNAKNGGVSDALREKNENEKRNKIVGANKKPTFSTSPKKKSWLQESVF